ncbi:SprB repeat-containing protein, partial [Flavobacterium granuli]
MEIILPNSTELNRKLQKIYFLFLFLLYSLSFFGQQQITPTKTIIATPSSCNTYDVTLSITGVAPVRPLDVVLVIDVSGSMSDNIPGDTNTSMYYAKAAATDFINNLFANNPTGLNRVAIVKYGTTATIVSPLTGSSGKTSLLTSISNLSANGGATNIQDGIVKADIALSPPNGNFDCQTARSIILLTDGVANRTGTGGNNCSSGSGGTCIQSAITAANAAKTTVVSSVVYENQIFSIGLMGGVSASNLADAHFALDAIQNTGGAFYTNSAANLSGIYSQILSQLSWAAKKITGLNLITETVTSGFTIVPGSIIASAGTTATQSLQEIYFNKDILSSETITLKYQVQPTPANTNPGNQTVSNTKMNYINSLCVQVLNQNTIDGTGFITGRLTASISPTNVNCKGGATGSATASATGGTPAYTYSWNTNPVQNTAVASGLAAGTYTVTVTDSKGCTDTEQITITEPQDALVAAIGSVTNVNCKDGATGSATASATGGTPAYTYSWNTNPVQNTAVASGLAAGTYTVTVTDSKGCTDTEQITITEPQDALVAAIGSVTNVNCKGGATGSATASATGGTPAYTYSWNTNPVQNTAVASGLAAGTYTVTITDSKGCTDTEQITITEPQDALVAAIGSVTNVNCKGGATGSATASATGGTPAYTYSWNTNPVQNTAVASGLAAGTYTVTVTDSKGCTDTEQITITEPENVLVAAIGSVEHVNCKGGATGSATASATGGTPAYTYSWNTNPVQNTALASGLAAGTYTVTVTDSKGCTDTEQITITEPQDALVAAIGSVANVNCKGGATGSATASATGGTATYTYSWNTNPIQNTAVASGLAAGTYTVTVTDSKGCSDTEQITITEPQDALVATIGSVANVNCKGGATGSATASATGGTPAYTYSWNTNPVQNTAVASGLAAGTYTVTVTDSKGCSDTEQITITEPQDALVAAIGSVTNVNCKGGATGSANASATGGTATYTYSWNTNPVQNTAVASGLAAGTYTVTVTDSKGCSDTEQITITEPQDVLTCSIIQDKAVSSNGLSDGEATVTPLGGNGGYTYLWD